ncbi:Bye1 protein [Maudiozyma humilis]|uniref:Transcription factor BYE1 n=1 Tax=Maudiozyma humilis TaxID=51915 RepID=A0AAV5RPX0_MAUHU|nr:Bye1 protein [Kazachstania humilis]
MSVRASTRATRGQNRYREQVLKEEAAYTPHPAEVVHCTPCGANDDNYNEDNDPHGEMVQCDGCDTWQHIVCMTDGGSDIAPCLDAQQKYYCERCRPERYAHRKSEHTDDAQGDVDPDSGADSGADADSDDAYVEDESAAARAADDDFLDNDGIDEDMTHKNRQTRRDRKRKLPQAVVITAPPANTPKRAKMASKKALPASPLAPTDPNTKTREGAKKMFVTLFEKYVVLDTVAANAYHLPEGECPASVAPALAATLEGALYEYCYNTETKQLSPVYKEQVRRLFSNLKDKKNAVLKSHVVNGTLAPAKLVRMNINELANPDLQEFKVAEDAKSLKKITIEEEPAPQNQTDDSDEFNNDVIYEMNNIRRRSTDEESKSGPGGPESPITIPSTSESIIIPDDEPLSDNVALKRVKINYDEAGWSIDGFLKYLGSSKEMDKSIYRNAADDGKLQVEGKLSSDKAFKYLNDVKSFRNVVTYQFVKPVDFSATENMNSMVDSLLMCSKVLGLTPKKKYERVIYIIPAENNVVPPVLEKIYESDPSVLTSQIEKFDKALFVVFLIKPELVPERKEGSATL